MVNASPEILMGGASPKALSLGRAYSLVPHNPDEVRGPSTRGTEATNLWK